MNAYTLRMIVSALLLGSMGVAGAAVDCDQASIAFYLEKGFSHDQIVKLCGENKAAKPAQSSDTETVETTPASSLPAQSQMPTMTSVKQEASKDNRLFIKLAIEADKVEIDDQTLVYQRQECFEEEVETSSVFTIEGCGLIRTEIQLAGLKVIKAQKGTFFIRDTELIVNSKIHRQILFKDELARKDREALDKLMNFNPAEVNIPLRDGFEPTDIAERLQQL